MRKVCGVGINDANYAVQVNEKISAPGEKVKLKVIWTCPFYSKWKGMLYRCYSVKFASKQKTYIDCEVCEEWLTFSNFRAWMEHQDWKDKELDKDLLVKGNKIYSPETCTFISSMLNLFLIESNSSRGEWPIGVCRQHEKFMAYCSNPFTGRREYLGLFSDPQQAHVVWLKRKQELALQLSKLEKDPHIVKALVERYLNYK